jgi:glutamate N-acetyltransferase/amino-acid N-acetyltransferase
VRSLGPRFDAAAVFTSNRVFAPSVGWTRAAVADGQLSAVVLNSGGANACTGEGGRQDTARTAVVVAEQLDCMLTDVGVCSTGIIGVRLPMDKLEAGVAAAAEALDADGGDAAANAIITTDTHAKTGRRPGRLRRRRHGQGRGHARARARDDARGHHHRRRGRRRSCSTRALRAATHARSTGSTPTAACRPTTPCCCWPTARPGSTPEREFTGEAPHARSARDLARQLIADAEGAEHEVAIEVVNAATEDDALEVARRCPVEPVQVRDRTATTRTGVAWSPRSAPRRRRSSQSGSTCPSTASWCAATVPIGEDRSLVDLKPPRGRTSPSTSTRAPSRDDLDQRPHRRLRHENADYPT